MSSMCAKLRTMAASNNRDHARNLSYYCLLAPRIYVFLFFAHIPFMVNHTINKKRKDNQWKYLWTSNGRIFARESDNSSVIQIKDECDIQKIKWRTESELFPYSMVWWVVHRTKSKTWETNIYNSPQWQLKSHVVYL